MRVNITCLADVQLSLGPHVTVFSTWRVFSDLSETTAKVEARKGEDAVDEAAIESKIRSWGRWGRGKKDGYEVRDMGAKRERERENELGEE